MVETVSDINIGNFLGSTSENAGNGIMFLNRAGLREDVKILMGDFNELF